MLLQAQVQVLRAGLGENVVALVARGGHVRQGVGGREVHDVQRRAGHERQLDGPVGGLAFQPGRPRDAVVHRVGLAPGGGLGGDDVDGDAVLGVHHDEPAVVVGLLHGPQDLAVVAVEHARVGHEQLEAGDAVVDERVHLLQRPFVDATEDHVEGVVDGALPLGLGEPGVEAFPHVLPLALHGEVDDGGGAAVGRRTGAGFERVRGVGPPEGQLHVRMDVHAAGHHVAVGGVDDAYVTAAAQGLGQFATGRHDCFDRAPRHQNVGLDAAGCADDRPVGDERAHCLLLFSGCRGGAPGDDLVRRRAALPVL